MQREVCAEVPGDAGSYDEKSVIGTIWHPQITDIYYARFRELITLSNTDGELSEEENQIIRELANTFGISEEALDKSAATTFAEPFGKPVLSRSSRSFGLQGSLHAGPLVAYHQPGGGQD